MSLRMRADVALCETEDALVLLDERTGRYFQVNRTGAMILKELMAGSSVERVAANLARTYPVTLEEASHDVKRLLDQLTEEALVVS
ncbi:MULTISPECIES: lasso peptide biosynthesis PqqD family chaperone [Streptomyces]|uniref:lasso peptide biosynthesis PqqD family chaperone n=1 Tax=Streptomyces TaxID=1883 RepID=UPI002020B57A|nr:lasso peptide biosynthesis PqqD family chaperone [Streptomyces sp. MCA2]MCL7496835.1 lasso peptide biosynthesis PqqD family chaperone [Streptomyces sp. MCA2]